MLERTVPTRTEDSTSPLPPDPVGCHLGAIPNLEQNYARVKNVDNFKYLYTKYELWLQKTFFLTF
jgi:hypothetical protein